MGALRWALLAAWLVPAVALGQNGDDADDPNKVSNDQPGRPLQMPPASSEVKEALDDFDRFARRDAWERALKALYTIPEDQARRFVDGDDGFIVPVARKRRELLVGLPPAGQAAYRLFYDDEAKTLLEEARGPSELETLERLYSAYFPTSVGDDAADRLGDLYFEMGRFDRAADCWLAVLRDRPETDLAPATLAVKAALALARAGRRAELAELRRDLAGRFAGEEVTLGGLTGTPEEVLRDALGIEPDPQPPSATASAEVEAEEGLDLRGLGGARWQVRFADSVVAGMTPPERTQWESNALSAAVPAVAVDGGRLFASYLGHDFAVDLETGKMLWRSKAFHQVEASAMQPNGAAVDPKRFAIVAEGDYLWSLGRDLSDQNYNAPFTLTCRRTDRGDVLWRSADLPDYAQMDFDGPPLLAGGTLFITAKAQGQQGLPSLDLLAIRPRDGKLLWKAEIGSLREGQRYYYYGMAGDDPQPQILYRAGAVYVDTHAGVLARIDAESGSLDWGFGYPTDPPQSQGRFVVIINGYAQQSPPTTAASPPLWDGEALLVKGAKSDRLSALDPDRMTRLWDRPIARASRLLGTDGGTLLLGGPDLDGLDLATRDLLWSTRLPGGTAQGRPLLRAGAVWQLTPRGVFEVDPEAGEVRHIFRGDDTGSTGGDLYLADRLLLAVTNRTISAYDLSAARDAGGEPGTKGESDEDE